MDTATPALPKRQLQLEPRKLTVEREKALRAACLKDLPTFGETFSPGWIAYDFHVFLAAQLQRCLARNIKRLALSVPPQHGKSKESSAIFPAWALTKFPSLRFFQAGWSDDLSTGFCRESRSICTSPAYLHFFPDIVNPMVNRQDYWQTKLGGYYYSTVVGGGTGMPADILIIDDPHKDRTDANSPAKRKRIWDWVTSTAMVRLSAEGVMIVIHTRWHDDDLIGRLTNAERVAELKEAGFDHVNFEVLSVPALCENPPEDPLGRVQGAALVPEMRSQFWLNAKKVEIGPEEFDSLYQQKPAKPGGNLADITLIKKIDMGDLPKGLRPSRAWDLALTEDQLSDYSAGARGAVHKYKIPGDKNEKGEVTKWIDVEDFYLFHMWRGKKLWPEMKKTIIEYGDKEAADGNIVGLETVGGFKIAGHELVTEFAGRSIVKPINVHKDKPARAQRWMGKIQAGRFFVVRGPWVKEFEAELKQFPFGVHDDQVDAVSLLWETTHTKDELLMA